MIKITEKSSLYNNLEQKSVEELTAMINREDQRVPLAIEAALPQLNELIKAIVLKLKAGGYRIVHMRPKFALTTLAQYDDEIRKDVRLPMVSTRPTSSVVRTVE